MKHEEDYDDIIIDLEEIIKHIAVFIKKHIIFFSVLLSVIWLIIFFTVKTWIEWFLIF